MSDNNNNNTNTNTKPQVLIICKDNNEKGMFKKQNNGGWEFKHNNVEISFDEKNYSIEVTDRDDTKELVKCIHKKEETGKCPFFTEKFYNEAQGYDYILYHLGGKDEPKAYLDALMSNDDQYKNYINENKNPKVIFFSSAENWSPAYRPTVIKALAKGKLDDIYEQQRKDIMAAKVDKKKIIQIALEIDKFGLSEVKGDKKEAYCKEIKEYWENYIKNEKDDEIKTIIEELIKNLKEENKENNNNNE